jgi:hypothetical protein
MYQQCINIEFAKRDRARLNAGLSIGYYYLPADSLPVTKTIDEKLLLSVSLARNSPTPLKNNLIPLLAIVAMFLFYYYNYYFLRPIVN